MPIDIFDLAEDEGEKERSFATKKKSSKKEFDAQKFKEYGNCLAFKDLQNEVANLKQKDTFIFFDKNEGIDKVLTGEGVKSLKVGIDVGVDWIINHARSIGLVDLNKCPSEKEIMDEAMEQKDFLLAKKTIDNAKCEFITNIQGFAFYPSNKTKFKEEYHSRTMKHVPLKRSTRVGVLYIAGRGDKFSEPDGIIRKLKAQYCSIQEEEK